MHSQPIPLKLSGKFTEKHLDDFIHRVFEAYKKYGRQAEYHFDLSYLSWTSNQNLLVFAGILKYLYISGNKFYVKFLPVDYAGMDYRTAKQIVQIWETWKIIQVVDISKFDKYFDLTADKIKRLKEHKGVEIKSQEIYDFYEVTPLILLDKLSNYTDKEMNNMLSSVFRLDQATTEILKLNNCSYPFENNTVNYIIIKELYENFLDHFKTGVFKNQDDFAFISLSLNPKLRRPQKEELPSLLQKNISEEYPKEYEDFFKDKSLDRIKNIGYVHLSFLDFGEGIPTTIKDEYLRYLENNEKEPSTDLAIEDCNALVYAFRFDSSRHPLSERFQKNITLPRGLFDVLSIVKRYEGLLVVQSNYGKILYDFSNDQDIKSSLRYVETGGTFFPGTLISIYIPERERARKIDYSAIKPVFRPAKSAMGTKTERFVNIFQLQTDFQNEHIETRKENLYNQLFERLSKVFRRKQFNTIYYVDFTGYEVDTRLTKKIIYFLISDYSINISNNIIVVHPPQRSLLEEINSEILTLTEVDRKFRIHPTPFIYFDANEDDSTIFWLGIYNKEDLKRLKYIQSIEHGLRKSDFQSPDDIVGHVNLFDKHGNLISLLSSENVANALERIEKQTQKSYTETYFKDLIEKYPGSIFLMPQNFYQAEYINILEPIADRQIRGYLANLLAERVILQLKNSSKYKIVTFSDPAIALVNESSFRNVLKYPHVHIPHSHFAVDKNLLETFFKNGDGIVVISECLYSGIYTAIC